jgi:hypothetical protein
MPGRGLLGRDRWSGGADEAELLQGGDAVVDPQLLSVMSPFSTLRIVTPVKRMALPVPAGRAPIGRSSKASPVWVPLCQRRAGELSDRRCVQREIGTTKGGDADRSGD